MPDNATEEASYAQAIVETVSQPLLVLDGEMRVASANPAFFRHFRAAPETTLGSVVYDLGNRQWDIPELHHLLEEVLSEHGRIENYRLAHTFADIGKRILLLNANRIRRPGGPERILLAISDVTERERLASELEGAETRQKAFMGELNHRVKNIIDIVRSLAAHTRRGSRSLDEFFQAFEARLGALARTQDLLVASPPEAVALDDIVRRELEAVGADTRRHFTAQGPPVHLPPRDVQAAAMTIHELATNAAKYGALAVQGARIEIVWAVERRNGRDHLSFHWRERGVPIADTEPPKGFGSRVIEESLPHMLGGAVELTFHPDGIACRLDFPLPR